MTYITTFNTTFFILVALQIVQWLVCVELFKTMAIGKQLIFLWVCNAVWVIMLTATGYFISFPAVTTFLFACTAFGLPVGFYIGYRNDKKQRQAMAEAE